MASPIWEGTFSSSAFSSSDIDILKEKIYLKVDKDFRTAFYQIVYIIRTDTNGKQIPLLFHAKDYKGDFKIWIDNREVKLLDIPSEYKTAANSPFEKFSNSFEQPSRNDQSETVVIYWEKNSGFVYDLNDLKYFETDLARGEHQIRVEYTANVWTDISDWVKEYSFRYSLSPAKNWKSFGSLEVTLDASDFNSSLRTNLGQQTNGRLDSISVWNFSKLPADYFEIIYTPEISAIAKTLIAISPFGLTLFFALLIAFLHFICIKKYRKSEPTKKYSWVVIAGSITLTFFILISYMVSFGIIDNVIGDEAGNYHGYTFLVIILYPLLLPVYWTIMWLADKRIKGRINNAQ
jgi:hypothetical protein